MQKKEVLPLIAFFVLIEFILPVSSSVIKGKIIDSEDKSPLAGVNIVVENTLSGTSSDLNGKYKIKLKPKKYKILFSMIGYQDTTITIVLLPNQTKVINVGLRQTPLQMKGIIVEEKRLKENVETNYRLSARSVKNMPSFMEEDVIRTASNLPGVVNYNDYKSNIIIRGSAPDQTQLLFDGMEIYYPWHIFGGLSSFNIETIDHVDIFTGGFPVRYGNRTGGLINIKSNEFSNKRDLKVSIGLLTSSVYFNKRFEKFGVLFAFRKTYFDILSSFFQRIPFSYIDANLKLGYQFNNNWNLQFISFLNNDFFTISTGQIGHTPEKLSMSDFFKYFFKGDNNWGNQIAGFNLNYKKDRLKSSVLLYRSKYYMSFKPAVNNYLNDYSIKQDLSYLCSDKVSLNLGAQYKKVFMNYDWNYYSNDLYEIFPSGLYPFKHDAAYVFPALYAQTNWITKRWDVQFGLRDDYINSKHHIQPRLAVKYNLTEGFNIHSAAGIYYQFMNSPFEKNVFIINSPLLFSKEALRLHNFSIGLENKINPLINSSVELYYKKMYHLPLGKGHAAPTNAAIGNASAFGMDFFIVKDKGFITWQLVYSYLKTQGNLNNNTFPLDWEITHYLSLLAGVQLKKGWYVNFGFFSHSGMPYTPVLSSYYGIINETNPSFGNRLIYGERNSANYPFYSRIDFSVRKRFVKTAFDIIVKFQIINLLYRKNILMVDWQNFYNSPDKYKETEDREGVQKGIPILPSLEVEINFK